MAKTSNFAKSRIWDCIIQGYCVHRNDPERAMSIFRDCLRGYRVLPSSYAVCSLIHGFSSRGMMGRAIEVMELMADEKIEYPFGNFVCSSVIAGFCRIGQPELGVEFFEKAKILGTLQPNLVTYTALVHALCKSGRVDEVGKLFRVMEEEGLAFDVVFFTCWVLGYLKQGFVTEAFRKNNEMLEKGISADVISYTVLMEGFSREENAEKAAGFLSKMRNEGLKPNIITYTVVILGLCRKGKLEEAYNIFKMIEDIGMVTDELLYATLIDGACRKGDFDLVLDLLSDMDRKRISPSVVTYNIVVNGLCKFERTCDADEFSKGVVGDVVTYSTLLHGYIGEKNVHGVLDIRRRFEEAGFSMDIVMCNILIKASFMVGAFEDAHALYKRMANMNLTADSITYCTLIDGFCKLGRIDEALEIFDEFRETSISSVACYLLFVQKRFFRLCVGDLHVDEEKWFTYYKQMKEGKSIVTLSKSVFKILIQDDRVLDAYKLLMGAIDHVPMDVVDYSIVVNGLCKRGYLNQALDLCSFIRKKGIALNVVSYNSVINGLCRQGQLMEAFRLCDSLERVGLVPSEITYGTLIDALCREQFLIDAQLLFQKMILKGLEPGTHVYNSLIDSYSKIGMLDNALKLLHEMEMKGLKVDAFTVSAVINGFCQSGDMEGALTLFSEFKNKAILPDLLGFQYLLRGLSAKGRMEEARNVLREMLQSQPIVELIDKVDSEFETESLNFLVLLCEQGNIKGAITLLDEIGNMYHPIQKFHADLNESSKPNMRYEGEEFKTDPKLNDFDSFYSLVASLCSSGEVEKANLLLKGFVC
ncbi:hypothetical protein EUGRSUZ_D01013 [Eucalyptus grandis]|uniref:Pentacotripeptide-repeat region of PRORP domain-containing protein n=1 Tax=Eucalyptus grandis TaxID=71139 RepID=A0A059CEE7_EUCGR|nr:hypothetical protein EUGRSUZ_D01013 [Eucalyptus grandis]